MKDNTALRVRVDHAERDVDTLVGVAVDELTGGER
jgi:hypothetical protein